MEREELKKMIEAYAELNYFFNHWFKSCALRITDACYCRDSFHEADIEYNEFFDYNYFKNFEDNHDYEEF